MGHEPAIMKVANGDPQFMPPTDQLFGTVVQGQSDVHLRMRGHVVDQGGGEDTAAKPDRRDDPQLAARRALPLGLLAALGLGALGAGPRLAARRAFALGNGALDRARAYAGAGADGIFVTGLSDLSQLYRTAFAATVGL